MSRRKQAKLQHNTFEDHLPRAAGGSPRDVPGDRDGEMSSRRCRTEETKICEKCCAEFFVLSEFLEHKKNCTKNPPVLIMNDSEGTVPPESFSEASLGNFPSDRMDSRTRKDIQAKGSTGSMEKREEKMDAEWVGGMYLQTEPQVTPAAPGLSYLPKSRVPNTDVTLQAIRGTKVDVNQQTSDAISSSAASFDATPMILGQLMCLQQQQLQQIQLTMEQIHIQIAMMVPHALHPSLAAATDPLKALGADMSQQLSAPLALIGQKAGNQSLSLESLKQGKLPHSNTAASSAPQTISSLAGIKESLPGMFSSDLQSRPSPDSEGGFSSSSGLVGYELGTEQSLSSPQATCSVSISHVSGSNEQGSGTSKPQQLGENIDKSTADPNECLICHRVLSSRKLLKVHYCTHTRERPFKCNICGRGFSTKGNLKSHCGVHRANSPLKMQHPCPICQKKFTNAVQLQQHIRMHMAGQIPNTPIPENTRDSANVDPAVAEKDGDISRPDETVESIEVGEGMDSQDGPSSSSKPTPYNARSVSPATAASFSGVTALGKEMKIVTSSLCLQRQSSLKSGDNGSTESDGMTNDSSSVAGDPGYQNSRSSAASESVSLQALSPANSQAESMRSKSPAFNNQEDSGTGNKTEGPENAPAEMDRVVGASELTDSNISLKVIKEEPGFHFATGEYGRSSTPAAFVRAPPALIKMEMPSDHPISTSHFIGPPALSPGVAPLLVPQPKFRRPAKQHICPTCGKNFSSASALRIHERSHTGEKPFPCTICGRPFSTKGNLKTHVRTHMWSNSASWGRWLSIDNPMALLGNDPKKVSEMFPKDITPPSVSIDPTVWNQHAAVLSNGITMKTNEISVIQSGGLPTLPLTIGGGSAINTATVTKMDGTQSGSGSETEKASGAAADNVPKHQFPHFMEENKITVS